MILIIGAGLTGLSAAYHLEKRGITDLMICEKEARPGGLLRSARVDGFTFDYTGHFLHINNTDFANFLYQVCPQEAFSSINRQSAVYTHGRINPYPFQMNLYGLPPQVITDCITGYVNRATHIKRPATFAQWVYKYFGRGIAQHFFFPFQSKILSYDLRKIEPSWTGRFVPKTNLAAMIEGAIRPRQPAQKVGYNSHLVYPTNGGIDYLINNLKNKLTTPINTGYQLCYLDQKRKKATFTNGKTVSYTHLISTMPLNHLLNNMAPNSANTVSQQASRLKCNSVLNINLGLSRPDVGDVHWLYVPDPALPFYRLGFWHNICPALAPAGHGSLYAELSFMPGRDSKSTAQRKRAAALSGIKQMLGLSNNDVILEHDLLLPHAYVIYDQWRKQNISRLLTQLTRNDIHSIGRFGHWKYSSMQEAVLDGRDVAATLADYYKNNQQPSSRAITCDSTR